MTSVFLEPAHLNLDNLDNLHDLHQHTFVSMQEMEMEMEIQMAVLRRSRSDLWE